MPCYVWEVSGADNQTRYVPLHKPMVYEICGFWIQFEMGVAARMFCAENHSKIKFIILIYFGF